MDCPEGETIRIAWHYIDEVDIQSLGCRQQRRKNESDKKLAWNRILSHKGVVLAELSSLSIVS
jgi:hypothetical protein